MISALAAVVLASACAAGPDWEEGAKQDAGSLPTEAQPARGFGPLRTIEGNLEGLSPPGRGALDFQDMYLIGIDDPENFTATTRPSDDGFAEFDAQLFLFFAGGRGLLASLDTTDGPDPLILPRATDDTEATIPYKGRYLLAISGRGSHPRSQQGDSPIFEFDSQFEVSGPDGPGAMFPIDAWTAPGQFGRYLIVLTGATRLPFGCNMADVAPPVGTLDFSDVVTYLNAFAAGDLIAADLAAPFGALNFADVLAFLAEFGAGCP